MATPRTRGVVPALPPVPTSYQARDQVDYGRDVTTRETPRDTGRESRVDQVSRLDIFEDRLISQETRTQALLDRAFRIKEDIIDNLNFTHGTWQEEKRARELLQEHIRSITDVVKKLSRDIQLLCQLVEGQLQEREAVASGASNAVKNLEVHHVAGLTDLRGRVARCDAAIAKLSSDIRGCTDSLRSANKQASENQGQLGDRLKALDFRISELTTRIERGQSDADVKLRSVEDDSTRQLTALDSKTKSVIDDLRTALHHQKNTLETEREKGEARLQTQVERSLQARDTKQETYERHVEESLTSLNSRLLRLEDETLRDREKGAAAQQALERRVQQAVDLALKKQSEDLARLKRECREGFGTVHESISDMKQVLDGKRKLLEDQMRKEISQIRKMVVLI